jgi:hypothetical protein
VETARQVPRQHGRLQANVGRRDDFPERGLTHRADGEKALRSPTLTVSTAKYVANATLSLLLRVVLGRGDHLTI